MAGKEKLSRKILFGVWITLLCLCQDVSPYGAGAPFSTCLTRYPKHSHKMTQSSESPFKIHLHPVAYERGDVINVTISSDSARPFTGFELAGFRTDNPLEIVGQFDAIPEDKAKTFSCLGGYSNIVTHKNKDAVSGVTFTWKSPGYNAGDITFKATVVENYETFWTNVESDLQSDSPSPIREPGYENVPADEVVQGVDIGGCGESKTCFLYPRHCDGNDCVAAVSFEYTNGVYSVEMYADSGSNPGYVGVAFSDDQKMGQDETYICAANSAEMSVQHGFNPAYYNERLITQFISGAQVKHVDGRIECRFTMDPNSTVTRVNHQETQSQGSPVLSHKEFTKDISYYIQLAWGEIMADSNVITLHKEMPATTLSKVHLREVDTYRGSAFHILVQVHGAVMIIAWTFLSGIVTVIARHYREMLPSKRCCGTKIWFQLHRGLAILVLILTGIGLAVIFIHYGTPIRKHAETHAYWGIAVAAAVGLQVIAGMLRPGPDHKLRFLFNWGHRFMGQASHVLAAVTMFLAFDFDYLTEDMKNFGFIALCVWAGVQLMWHIFFEIINCVLRRNEPDSYSLEKENSSDSKSYIPAVLMVLYVMFLAACSVAVLCAFLFY